MKKLLAKIALFTIINLMIIPLAMADNPGQPPPPPIINGDGEQPPAPPIVGGDAPAPAPTPAPTNIDATGIYDTVLPCIEDFKYDKTAQTKTPGADTGYVVSIIEEPLGTKDTPQPDGDYVSRTCYRNTFEYTDLQNKKSILPWLGRTCSKKAQDLYIANQTTVKYSCKEVQAILTKGGVSGIYGYIGMIYRWGASMAGIVAVTVIILSGIQISASGGDQEAIGAGKKRILQSIAGILVLFLSSLILYTINPTFFTK